MSRSKDFQILVNELMQEVDETLISLVGLSFESDNEYIQGRIDGDIYWIDFIQHLLWDLGVIEEEDIEIPTIETEEC